MDPVRKREDSGVFTVARAATVELHPDPSSTASPPAPTSDRDVSELLDVPAAVVCARCGCADCVCCDERSRSGIIGIVPWERTGVGFFARLWQTTRATSRDAGAFFEVLPDGPAGPALRFAFAAELIAVSSFLALAAPLALVLAPGLVGGAFGDAGTRWVVARGVLVGLPALSLLLVAAHVFHGLGIAYGARRSGAPPRLSRALRFGLYSAGWDLAVGPFGFVAMALEDGLRAALALMGQVNGMPTRSTLGFLRGAYHLDGPAAKRALQTSYVAATVATLATAFLILAMIVAVAI